MTNTNIFIIFLLINLPLWGSASISGRGVNLVIRLALFVDTSLEKHLRSNLQLNDQTIEKLLFAYVKQIEAIFSDLNGKNNATKIRVKLAIIYFETKLKDKIISPNYSNWIDIDKLLDNFCYYQANVRLKQWNKPQMPLKWDLSLLLTAQDIYSEEEAQAYSMEMSLSTMGISVINGVHWPDDLGCLIVEFGVNYLSEQLKDFRLNSSENRVYPTRGFTSTWIAAHEIAHSLGIHHDGLPFNQECDPNKWIMSANSFIGSMNIFWSDCSANAIDQLDLIKKQSDDDDDDQASEPLPGQLFDANFQCKTYSNDLMAHPELKESICNESLWCFVREQHDHLSQLIAIGPALEGTKCHSDGSVCIGKKCQRVSVQSNLNKNS